MTLKQHPWLILGQLWFGLLLGLIVGLSASPIVETAIGLLFAFIGGSLVFLIKDRKPEELETIGMCLSVFAFFMILGIIAGILLRTGMLADDSVPEVSNYDLGAQLTITDIEVHGSDEVYAGVLCNLIVNNPETTYFSEKKEITGLMDKGVRPEVLMAMLDRRYNCSDGAVQDESAVAEPCVFCLFSEFLN